MISASDLDKLIGQYKQLSKGTVDHDKYAYYAITHHSTSIEGSTLTESQVINLLEYGKTAPNRPFEHHQMVFDHYEATKFIVDYAAKQKALDARFLRQLCAKLMHSTGGSVNTIIGTYDIALGDFRLGSVRAGTRTFPDYKKVPMLVDRLCEKLNEGLSQASMLSEKCELAFMSHFELVSIHPFGDGNGRTSRLLMNYIFERFGLPMCIVFKQDRIKYINALEGARKIDELTPFYQFMYGQYTKFLKNEIAELSN